MKKLLAGAVIFGATLLGVGSAASAGEITGNGELKEVKGHSICAFSGQNDGYHIPEHAEDEFDASQRVQSFGQVVKYTGPIGGVPGFECNPTRSTH